MDYTTLFTVLISSLLIQSIALWLTWRHNRDEIGLRDLALAGVVLVICSVTSSAGLSIEATHPTLSLNLRYIGSASAVTGWALVWIAARHFHARAAFRYRYLVPLFLASLFLSMLNTEPYWRVTIVSTSTALASSLVLREFFDRHHWRSSINLFALTMLAFSSIVWAGRALSHVVGDSTLNAWDTLSLYTAIVVSFAMTLSMIILTNARINRKLVALASHDPLTGALNRRAFYEKSDALLSGLRRLPTALSVCIIDLDHFKQVNDTHGHAAGDEVLKRFSHTARNALRSEDLFARYGGEEFVVLLHNSELPEAQRMIERLRHTLHSEGVQLSSGKQLEVTFSAGLSHARGPTDIDLTTLLGLADQSLYEAKAAGRNRTVVAPETLTA